MPYCSSTGPLSAVKCPPSVSLSSCVSSSSSFCWRQKKKANRKQNQEFAIIAGRGQGRQRHSTPEVPKTVHYPGYGFPGSLPHHHSRGMPGLSTGMQPLPRPPYFYPEQLGIQHLHQLQQLQQLQQSIAPEGLASSPLPAADWTRIHEIYNFQAQRNAPPNRFCYGPPSTSAGLIQQWYALRHCQDPPTCCLPPSRRFWIG